MYLSYVDSINVIPATQVTTLVSSKSPQKKKGKSKRAHVLVAAVERATAIFVERGELIAVENPDIKVITKHATGYY